MAITLEDIAEQLKSNNAENIDATRESTSAIVGSFNSNFAALVSAVKGDRLDALENQREAERRSRLAAGGILGVAGSQPEAGGSRLGGFGGLFGGLGMGLGGLGAGAGLLAGGVGVGAGAALGGAGIGLAGLAALLFAIDNLDGKKVRANVNEILAIKDDVESAGDVAVVAGTLGALGLGLIAFSAGSALATVSSGMAEGVELFTKEDWAETVKQNVLTLLSIGDELKGGEAQLLYEAFGTGGAFLALGAGLAAFAVGEGLASGAQGMSAAVEMFSKGNWAENVKQNVLTLLSIGDEFKGGEAQVFAEAFGTTGALAVLGAGLVAFSVGEATASGAASAAAAVELFSGQNWAEAIKQNVLTLLSIDDAIGGGFKMLGESALFTGAMGVLSAGLVAFALGEGAVAASGATSGVIDFFQGQNWAERIVDNVHTLLSINDMGTGNSFEFLKESGTFFVAMTAIAAGLTAFATSKGMNSFVDLIDDNGPERIVEDVEKLLSINDIAAKYRAGDFVKTMGELAAGIAAVSLSDGIGALANAGEKILGFFTGSKSPIDEVLKLADKQDDISKVGDGLLSVANALKMFSEIDVDVKEIDFSKLTKNIKKALPELEDLAKGDRRTVSIFDPSLRLDEMAVQIEKIRNIVGVSGDMRGFGVSPTAVSAGTLDQAEIRAREVTVISTGGTPSVTSIDASSNSSVSNSFVAPETPPVINYAAD